MAGALDPMIYPISRRSAFSIRLRVASESDRAVVAVTETLQDTHLAAPTAGPTPVVEEEVNANPAHGTVVPSDVRGIERMND